MKKETRKTTKCVATMTLPAEFAASTHIGTLKAQM
jgi:hypothetical protein